MLSALLTSVPHTFFQRWRSLNNETFLSAEIAEFEASGFSIGNEFKIRGNKGEITVYLSYVYKDRDGDVLYWEYRPSDMDIQNYPELSAWFVHIYND